MTLLCSSPIFFTVISSFVMLILISFSIGQEKRGAVTVAAVIGSPPGCGPRGRCGRR
jgi:hypothetical protein